MHSPHRTLGQKACLVLAWLFWIATFHMTAFTIITMFDSGPHGIFYYFWIIPGLITLLPAFLGYLFFQLSRTKSDQTKDR